jgi:hypothetical protein
VDQVFAAAGNADRPLPFAAHRPAAHDAVASDVLDAFPGDPWFWNRA